MEDHGVQANTDASTQAVQATAATEERGVATLVVRTGEVAVQVELARPVAEVETQTPAPPPVGNGLSARDLQVRLARTTEALALEKDAADSLQQELAAARAREAEQEDRARQQEALIATLRTRPVLGDAEAQTELVCIRQQRGLSIRNLSNVGTQTFTVSQVESSAQAEATVKQDDAEVQTDDAGPKWRAQVAEANLQLAARWRERFEDATKAANEEPADSVTKPTDAQRRVEPAAQRGAAQSDARASPRNAEGRARDIALAPKGQALQTAAAEAATRTTDAKVGNKGPNPRSFG
jgi:hypothetical protein